jgi:hypothetical protein
MRPVQPFTSRRQRQMKPRCTNARAIMRNLMSLLIIACIILAGCVARFCPLFREAGYRKLGFFLIVLMCFCGLPSFFAVVSFTQAEPSSIVRARHGVDIPSHWTAVVWNHGSYYRWYTIKDHPRLFALSVLGLVAGVVPLQILVLYSMWKRETANTELPQSPSGRLRC